MAVKAPFHLERRIVVHQRHTIDRAMADVTTHALGHVDTVIEVNVVGQIVDPVPNQRLSRTEALAYRLEQRCVGPYLGMTVHASLCRRNPGETRDLDRGVAVTAVNTQASNVMLMAKRHRLRTS